MHVMINTTAYPIESETKDFIFITQPFHACIPKSVLIKHKFKIPKIPMSFINNLKIIKK